MRLQKYLSSAESAGGFVSVQTLARLGSNNLDDPKETVDPASWFHALLMISEEQIGQFFTVRDCQPGEIIFREGQPGDVMYLISSGRVAVVKGNPDEPVLLGYRSAGESIGEMALLDDQPRSATVIALTPMQLLAINRQNLGRLLWEFPQASQAIMGTLNVRLRESSLNIQRLEHMVNALQSDLSGLEQAHLALELANRELSRQLGEVQALQARLKMIALRDRLTGLYNRHSMEDAFEREFERAVRRDEPLSLMLMDVDHFKRINDTYGHRAGDEVLQRLGKLLLENVRRDDIPCRYGGEEFIVILPNLTCDIAAQRAEKLRAACEKLAVEFEGHLIRVTLSFGVSCYPHHAYTAAGLIQKADAALYESKQYGRNRVTVAA